MDPTCKGSLFNLHKYSYDIEDFDVDLPEEITIDWLKNNVKLITINILDKYQDFNLLEFDFAVSWDEEDGLRALVYKDKILDMAQGGCVWANTEEL